jgi:hypothetical protein
MSAEFQRIRFRFHKHDTVYLAGSREPYTVVGQMYITLASEPREERRYYLRSSLGDERWIEERHVLAAPARQVAHE